MTFQLVHETGHFIVVDKMPGVVSQGAQSASITDNLLAAVKAQFECDAFFPVHRLDADTSGLILLARTQTATRELSQAFAEHQVDKTYLALSDKKPKKKQGKIIGDMVKARNGCWKLTQERTNPASTQFFSAGMQDKPRLFLLKPMTGKTHQLRVAMKALGAPILGDARYGGAPADRMYLHAYQLGFKFGGKMYFYERPPIVGDAFLAESFGVLLRSLVAPK